MSTRFRIIFALACCVLSAILLYSYTERITSAANEARAEAVAAYGGEVVQLAVATRTLDPGDVVQPGDVELRDWAAELAPVEAYTSVDDILGLELTSVVAKGSVLSSLHFREATDLAEIPSNNVAYTISANDRLGISRSVARGTKLCAYKADTDGVHLIAKDISVLSGASTAKNAGQSTQITLAIPIEWASAVIEAATVGDLRLVEPSADIEELNLDSSVAPEEVAAEVDIAPSDSPKTENPEIESGSQEEGGQA